MKQVITYDVDWFERASDKEADDVLIDHTQVDENDEQLIWELFAEFGHKRTERTYYEVSETTEELDDDVWESIYGNINIE